MSNADTLRKLTLRRVFSFRKLLHVPTIWGDVRVAMDFLFVAN